MMEKLLSFLFLGILVSLGYRFGFDILYQRYFPAASFFQLYWYIPFVLVPAGLLALLARRLGFYRHGGNRGADALATLMLAAMVFLTIPASYSCGLGCF